LIDGVKKAFGVPRLNLVKNIQNWHHEGVIKHADLFVHPESDTKHAFLWLSCRWHMQINGRASF